MTTPSTSPNPTTEDPGRVFVFRQAYEELKEEINAVPDDRMATINIDVPHSATTMVGAWDRMEAYQPRMSVLAELKMEKVRKIRKYALALAHAQSVYQAATAPEPIDDLISEATTLARLISSDLSVLAKRGLIDAGRLDGLKSTTGYLDAAFNLSTLATVARDNQAVVAGKTALEQTEIERAETLATQIMDAVGKREHAPERIAAASLMRQKAFTLALEAYEEGRRAIAYLRWHEDDADEIAPSLYAGRSRRKASSDKRADAAAPTTPAAPAPAAPTTTRGPAGTPTGSPSVG